MSAWHYMCRRSQGRCTSAEEREELADELNESLDDEPKAPESVRA